jgi:hypothetical protein
VPSRDPLLRIQDILEAITKIQRYTDGMTLEVFSADEKTSMQSYATSLLSVKPLARYHKICELATQLCLG